MLVSGDWKAAETDTRDNWRKELVDAARFDPARASGTLLERTQLVATLCGAQATWVVGPNTAQLAYPWLANAQLVTFNKSTAVWRFASSASRDPHCLDVPSGALVPPTSAATGTNGND